MEGPNDLPSLKRHEALQPLSREHMNGLVMARNLKRAADGTEADRRRVVEDFLHAWKSEIAHHFDDEERLLMDLIAAADVRDRLLDEHRVLRDLAHRCENDRDAIARDPQTLRQLGVLLHDHIRWEERVLFELVQCEHPEALDLLLHEAHAIEENRPMSRARKRLKGWPEN